MDYEDLQDSFRKRMLDGSIEKSPSYTLFRTYCDTILKKNQFLTEKELLEFENHPAFGYDFQQLSKHFDGGFRLYLHAQKKGRAGLGKRETQKDKLQMLAYTLEDAISAHDQGEDHTLFGEELVVRLINIMKADIKRKEEKQ